MKTPRPFSSPERRQRAPCAQVSRLLIGLFFSLTMGEGVPAPALPSDDELFAMSLTELANITLVSASLTPQSLAESPASVSVLTAGRIRDLGARNLYDALLHLPGVRVDYTNRGRPIVSLRGVRRDTSNQLLFLLDGHVLNEPANGSATFLFELARLPLRNIQRIELVRGPGSALFGSNAFLGVVNIITYGPDQLDGLSVEVRSEFEAEGNISREADLLFGRRLDSGLGLALNLQLLDRDGERIEVPQPVSGHPDAADTEFEQIDLQARLEWQRSQLKARFTRHRRGEYYGPLYQLSPDDETRVEGGFVEWDTRFDPWQQVELGFRAYADHHRGKARISSIPRGTLSPDSPWAAFNETGRFSVLNMQVTKAGLEMKAADSRLQRHRIAYGALFEYQSQHGLSVLRNDIGLGRPLAEPRRTAETFGKSASRTLFAPFVEDIWRFADDWTLNAGLRFDHYSDFGGSLNPRLGLSWQLHSDYRLRALYGTAFRAPDFRSLFLESPVLQGNPDLQEERVRTLELGVDATPWPALQAQLTLFHNELEDLVAVQPGDVRFSNLQSQTSNGVEVALRYEFAGGASLCGNYTWLESRFGGGGQVPGEPRHSGSLSASVPLAPRLHGGLSLYWQGQSPRAPDDARGGLAAYAKLDLNLRYRLSSGLQLEAAAYNLLDAEYAYPAPAATVAEDFSAPGRSFLLGARFEL